MISKAFILFLASANAYASSVQPQTLYFIVPKLGCEDAHRGSKRPVTTAQPLATNELMQIERSLTTAYEAVYDLPRQERYAQTVKTLQHLGHIRGSNAIEVEPSLRALNRSIVENFAHFTPQSREKIAFINDHVIFQHSPGFGHALNQMRSRADRDLIALADEVKEAGAWPENYFTTISIYVSARLSTFHRTIRGLIANLDVIQQNYSHRRSINTPLSRAQIEVDRRKINLSLKEAVKVRADFEEIVNEAFALLPLPPVSATGNVKAWRFMMETRMPKYSETLELISDLERIAASLSDQQAGLR